VPNSRILKMDFSMKRLMLLLKEAQKLSISIINLLESSL